MSGARLFIVFGIPSFAALILIYLLLPGTLVGPGEDTAHDGLALQQRLDQLREFDRNLVCEAPGVGAPSIVPPAQEQESDRVFRPVPINPEQTPVPPEVARPGTEVENIQQHIVDGVALVIGSREGSPNFGIGSAFAIDELHFVTNFHVVEDWPRIRITSEKLGRFVDVEVVAVVEGSGGSEKPDLALLRSPEPLGLNPLPIVPYPNQMDVVFAAGYPAFVIQSDEDYQRLIASDGAAVPSPPINEGRISAIQNRGGRAPLLVHSAQISQGNSGGPLIDECGRVVGINTFLRIDEEAPGARTVYYALPSERMLKAFDKEGANFNVIEGYCGTVARKPVQPTSEAGSGTEDNE